MARAAKKRTPSITQKISVELNRGGESEAKTTLVTSARITVGNISVFIGPDKKLVVKQRQPTREYRAGDVFHHGIPSEPPTLTMSPDQSARIEFDLGSS